MKKDTLLYAAHSGIQKAVRRGNLDLAHTCFELMWADKQHQSWYKWRFPIIVIEDAYYLVGEVADFLNKRTDDKKEWKRMLYKVVLATKNKDSYALLSLATESIGNAVKGSELALVRKLVDGMTEENIKQKAEDAYDYLMEKREYTTYEQKAMQYLKARASMGGMVWDRYSMLPTMVLIYKRGLDRDMILNQVDDDVEAYFLLNGDDARPEEIAMPWYVFDMHTRIGMATMSIYLKKHGTKMAITRPQLERLWFLKSSGFVPSTLVRYPKEGKKPTCITTAWWDKWLAIACKFGKYDTTKKADAVWRSIEHDVQGIIKWLLMKEDKED